MNLWSPSKVPPSKVMYNDPCPSKTKLLESLLETEYKVSRLVVKHFHVADDIHWHYGIMSGRTPTSEFNLSCMFGPEVNYFMLHSSL